MTLKHAADADEEHRGSTASHEEIDDERQRRLDAARAQRDLYALLAGAIESCLFVGLSREHAHGPDRGNRLLDNRGELAFFLFDLACDLLDAVGTSIDDREQKRRDGHAQKRE